MHEPQFGKNSSVTLQKLYLFISGPNLKFHRNVPHNALYKNCTKGSVKVLFCLTKWLPELKNKYQQNFLLNHCHNFKIQFIEMFLIMHSAKRAQTVLLR